MNGIYIDLNYNKYNKISKYEYCYEGLQAKIISNFIESLSDEEYMKLNITYVFHPTIDVKYEYDKKIEFKKLIKKLYELSI